MHIHVYENLGVNPISLDRIYGRPITLIGCKQGQFDVLKGACKPVNSIGFRLPAASREATISLVFKAKQAKRRGPRSLRRNPVPTGGRI